MKRTLGFLVSILMMFSLPTACSKKQEEQRPSSAANPYTSESVYAEVQKKIESNPRDPDLWYHLSELYDRNAQYKEEIEALKKVIELKPDMGYAYFRLGTAYNRLGQHREAVESFKKALKYMPDYPVAYNNLAIAYGKLGMTDEEISALKKAIALRPSYATARYNLGVAYMKAGRKNEAMTMYRELKKSDEGMADALMKEIESHGRGK